MLLPGCPPTRLLRGDLQPLGILLLTLFSIKKCVTFCAKDIIAITPDWWTQTPEISPSPKALYRVIALFLIQQKTLLVWLSLSSLALQKLSALSWSKNRRWGAWVAHRSRLELRSRAHRARWLSVLWTSIYDWPSEKLGRAIQATTWHVWCLVGQDTMQLLRHITPEMEALALRQKLHNLHYCMDIIKNLFAIHRLVTWLWWLSCDDVWCTHANDGQAMVWFSVYDITPSCLPYGL